MQWQLDKRTHGDGAGAGTNGDHPSRSSSRHRAASKRRLVFHDRHTNRHNHQQRQPHPSTANGSISSSIDTGTSSDEASAFSSSNFVDQQHQQQLDAHAGRDPSEQFYCLHFDHAAAAQDANKAQERLAKHIQQVG